MRASVGFCCLRRPRASRNHRANSSALTFMGCASNAVFCRKGGREVSSLAGRFLREKTRSAARVGGMLVHQHQHHHHHINKQILGRRRMKQQLEHGRAFVLRDTDGSTIEDDKHITPLSLSLSLSLVLSHVLSFCAVTVLGVVSPSKGRLFKSTLWIVSNPAVDVR